MHPGVRDLSKWDALTDDERTRAALTLAPAGFEYKGLERHKQGGAARAVAMFTWSDGARFALVPGGYVELGFDRSAAPKLEDSGRKSWESSTRDFGFPDFETHLADVLLSRRRSELAPLLVEVAERPVGNVLENTYDHAALLASLEKDGFRLLTSDEWEHACRGGTRTVWRWGDTCPTDEEPYGE